ncbi:MAG TPA: DUF1707 domain-containing protein [Streptosporangiaceae bacterium]|jgi:hypothetical protein
MGDESLRVSDAEREQAVAALREHLLAGRLTLEEFSARVEAALSARVGAELARAQDDLPRIATPAAHPGRRKPARVTTGLFGHVARRGRLRLHRRAVAVSAFADVDFDLREATIDQSDTTMTVVALCGNIDIYVPAGVNVDVTGLAVFGHRRDWGNDQAAPDAPTINVRVIGMFGTVDVWRVPPGLQGEDWDGIIRHLQGGRKELPRNSA